MSASELIDEYLEECIKKYGSWKKAEEEDPFFALRGVLYCINEAYRQNAHRLAHLGIKKISTGIDDEE